MTDENRDIKFKTCIDVASRIVTASLLVILFLSPSVVCAQKTLISGAAIEGMPSVNPAITKIMLTADDVKTPLQVPTNYIDWDWTEQKNNEGPILWLKMLWPSLESTSVRFRTFDHQQYNDQEKLLQSGQAFRIRFQQYKIDHMKETIEWLKRTDWTLLANDPSVPGFTRYAEKIMAKNYVFLSQILVPSDPNYKQEIYFDCPANHISSKALYCTGYNYLGHYVYGEYIFSAAELKNWKQIDATVRQLFNGMLLPEKAD